MADYTSVLDEIIRILRDDGYLTQNQLTFASADEIEAKHEEARLRAATDQGLPPGAAIYHADRAVWEAYRACTSLILVLY